VNLVFEREKQRINIQHRLDSHKEHSERNKLGQFATPPALAEEILKHTHSIFPSNFRVRFLDPAIGTGSFFSALMRVFPESRIEEAVGYEIDPEYATIAKGLFAETPLKVICEDFTKANPPTSERNKFNLMICNPPYSRHHHLKKEEKIRLRKDVMRTTGIQLSGLSGIYCHFLCMSHAWLSHNGIAGWLIPSEFMDVNYGKALKNYLLNSVTLLRIHRFNPNNMQFKDAYVSSAIVWFRNAQAQKDTEIEFSYGGNLTSPTIVQQVPLQNLQISEKWTRYPETPENYINVGNYRLSDFFEIKRGLATGSNKFFIMTVEKARKLRIPTEFLRPILPPPRDLHVDLVEADENGKPILDKELVLLDCPLSEQTVRLNYPFLWIYLQDGIKAGIHKRYLCAHRSPWYAQENRPASSILCSYMGRSIPKRENPFRFVLNLSKATATNVWLFLYPKQKIASHLENNRKLLKSVWYVLNHIPNSDLMRRGRVYGGGLHKLEPRELGNAPADEIAKLLN